MKRKKKVYFLPQFLLFFIPSLLRALLHVRKTVRLEEKCLEKRLMSTFWAEDLVSNTIIKKIRQKALKF